MIYIKNIPTERIEDALVLDEQRVVRIKEIIAKAYHQHWDKKGPSVDQIAAYVAPEIRTPEEAFYAATVILTDVFNAMKETEKSRRK